MNKTLIALTAAAGLAAGLAISPAGAAPLAPKHLGFDKHETSRVELARHRHRHAHRHVHLRRHFWAPGPWAFRGQPYHNCFPVRGGYYCYY